MAEISLMELLGEDFRESPAVGQPSKGVIIGGFFKAFLMLLFFVMQALPFNQVPEGL